jgi:hypothetical protein
MRAVDMLDMWTRPAGKRPRTWLLGEAWYKCGQHVQTSTAQGHTKPAQRRRKAVGTNSLGRAMDTQFRYRPGGQAGLPAHAGRERSMALTCHENNHTLVVRASISLSVTPSQTPIRVVELCLATY